MYCAVRLLLCLCGMLLMVCPSWAEPVFYSSLSIESYSESFPVYDLATGLGQEFQTGKTHFAIGRMENGVRYNNAAVALVHRYEAFVSTSKAASELIWRNEADQSIPSGRQWPLSLRVNQVSMYGLALSYGVDLIPALRLSVSLQLLRAREMYDGEISGFIETYPDDYQGRLHLDYFYTRDVVWDRPTARRYGEGGALDIQLDWTVHQRHAVRLVVQDAVNGIYWKDMYYTTANLTSDRISYDENGKLNVRAAMSGYEGERDHWQRLPAKMRLRWAMQINDAHSLDTEWVRIEQYDDLLWHYRPAVLQGIYFSASIHGALGVAWQNRFVHTGLRLDDRHYKKAQSLAVWFNWQLGRD